MIPSEGTIDADMATTRALSAYTPVISSKNPNVSLRQICRLCSGIFPLSVLSHEQSTDIGEEQVSFRDFFSFSFVPGNSEVFLKMSC